MGTASEVLRVTVTNGNGRSPTVHRGASATPGGHVTPGNGPIGSASIT